MRSYYNDIIKNKHNHKVLNGGIIGWQNDLKSILPEKAFCLWERRLVTAALRFSATNNLAHCRMQYAIARENIAGFPKIVVYVKAADFAAGFLHE